MEKGQVKKAPLRTLDDLVEAYILSEAVRQGWTYGDKALAQLEVNLRTRAVQTILNLISQDLFALVGGGLPITGRRVVARALGLPLESVE